ncbi:MAG: diacylglycerol kinase family protein [Candidatus Omnitrophica bacterium]|nr:diacylglycerol kinase family protein [Candidatus Omnitrophota bacterium]
MAKIKVVRSIFKGNAFRESLLLAIKGIGYLFLYHRNMRIIFLAGIAVFLLGVYFNLKGIELVALCITVTVVFLAEMTNTAIELLMDMITDKYHTKIKLVKDISAAVVVLTCLNAVAVGYILFVRKIFK